MVRFFKQYVIIRVLGSWLYVLYVPLKESSIIMSLKSVRTSFIQHWLCSFLWVRFFCVVHTAVIVVLFEA